MKIFDPKNSFKEQATLKTTESVVCGDIYESFYRYGFWSKILGYGQITIRRTDGNTTNFIFDKMTNFKDLVGEINYKVQEFKKSNKQFY